MEKTYLNSIGPTKLKLMSTKNGSTALVVEFAKPAEWEGKFAPSVWLYLDEANNAANVKAIRALGADCPDELTPSAAEKLQVREASCLVIIDGKPKFINEGRVLRVFDDRK